MPGWDESENQWQYRVKSPGLFDKMRTVKITDGVSIIYGRKKGSDDWETQAYRFDKDKFSKAEAKKWLKDHPDAAKKNAKATNQRKWGFVAMSQNRLEAEDKGDYVLFKNVKVAAEGVMNGGLRTKEETLKMIPFCNGLRVVMDHPEFTVDAMTCIDLKDEKFPVVGWTENPRESVLDDISRAEVDLAILKKDRNDKCMEPIIEQIKDGSLPNVSIGYFFEKVPTKGEAYGQAYDHEEVDINPYHLAILTTDPPACAGPICGIGVASESFNQGGSGMPGDETPPGQGGTETPRVVKTVETPISAADMSVCALAGVNASVKALADEKEALKTKTADLEKKVEDLETEKKKGDEALTELEATRTKERETKVEELKKRMGDELFTKTFPEETVKDAADGELDRLLSLSEPTAQDDGEPEPAQGKADPVLKFSTTKPGANERKESALHLPNLCEMPEPSVRRRTSTKRTKGDQA